MDNERKLPAKGTAVKGKAGLSSLVPFGIGRTKPNHFLEMAGVLWENRDRLGYAWSILNHGVCDGCSLGPRGLEDDVISGTHLCMSRLKLLRNNTVGAFAEADVADIERLRKMSNRELRELGRIPYPFIYRPGMRGFQRLSWDDACKVAGDILAETPPERQAYFATSKGLTNETYYTFTKTARLMGTNNVDFCARLCHAATVSGLSQTIGVGAPTISLSDLIGTDLILLWGTNLANNQPVSVKYLHHAKEAGTRIVSINTLQEKGLDNYWIPSIPKSALFGSKLADDFIQVNTGVNQLMVQQALAWLQIDSNDVVLDLYAGVGNFSLPLAQRAKTVRAVEGVAKMVQQLATNAKLNGLSNVEAYQADLHLSWPKASWNTPEYTKVLLDPARAGAAGATEQIIKLKPAQILYVSCNAATFARDAKILLQSGYRLHKICGVDMFTHTNHLELMALFSRS